MFKPKRAKIELLSREFIEKIIDEAFLLLEKKGVFVENKEALKLLEEKGCRIEKDEGRVFIKSGVVSEALSFCPPKISLYDRSGEKEFVVGGDEVHFDPGSAAVTILDHETGEQRKPLTEDLIRFVRLTEYLKYIHFQSTGLVSSDIPEELSDCYRLYIGLHFSTKPIITGTFRVEGFNPMYEMLSLIRGSKKALEEKPLAVFDACPSPPLKWSNLTCQSLVDCARAGIPSELISMGMTGATSPVTLAGTLVQHTAENLSGIVICQLAKKGAPVIFGGSPSSFDMRRGTTPMGAIETMMIDSAYAQIGKHLNLPTHAYMGLSDAKTNDSQAGLETGIGAILAALSGINVVSGPGMMDFESCQSLEKLLIDNEICQMAYRLLEGISQRDEPVASVLFNGLSDKTQFLTMAHTREWYRKEHIFPSLLDRNTYEDWVSAGKKPLADKAAEEVERILRETPPSLPDKETRQELFKIMTAYARTSGIDKIPKLN